MSRVVQVTLSEDAYKKFLQYVTLSKSKPGTLLRATIKQYIKAPFNLEPPLRSLSGSFSIATRVSFDDYRLIINKNPHLTFGEAVKSILQHSFELENEDENQS
jgi:hypothetical protein